MRTFILFAIIVAGIAWFVTREKPGTGPKAQAGFAASAPLVTALQAYRDAHNLYPPSLEDLVPDYLSSVPSAINGHPPVYQAHGGSYELKFSYISPLPTSCTYTPERHWKCGWLQ